MIFSYQVYCCTARVRNVSFNPTNLDLRFVIFDRFEANAAPNMQNSVNLHTIPFYPFKVKLVSPA